MEKYSVKKKLYFLSFYFIFECHEVCPDADESYCVHILFVSDLSIKLSKQGRVHPWICAV